MIKDNLEVVDICFGQTDHENTQMLINLYKYHKEIENMGLFYRIDGQYQTFDAVSLSGGADNTINLRNLDGVVGSVSIGKSF